MNVSKGETPGPTCLKPLRNAIFRLITTQWFRFRLGLVNAPGYATLHGWATLLRCDICGEERPKSRTSQSWQIQQGSFAPVPGTYVQYCHGCQDKAP